MNSTEQNFPVELFIVLHKAFQLFNLWMECKVSAFKCNGADGFPVFPFNRNLV